MKVRIENVSNSCRRALETYLRGEQVRKTGWLLSKVENTRKGWLIGGGRWDRPALNAEKIVNSVSELLGHEAIEV